MSVNWFSKSLFSLATRVDAFVHPEQRAKSFSFSNWTAFSNWLESSVENDAEETVTNESGTKISTVWNCLNVLAQDIAAREFEVIKATKDGPDPDKSHNIYKLINRKPNRYENAWQFWYGMVFLGEGWGNSYAYIVRDEYGKPVELLRLKPWMVSIQYVDDDMFYLVDGKPISSRDIFHYRSFVLDSPEGVSKIMYNANLIGLKQKQNRYAARSTGNKPPGYLFSPNADQEQRKAAKESWDNNVKGDKIAGTAVLYGDWEYKSLMISPEAAEIVQMTEWTDTNTYATFRIQPVLASNHKNSNYSNAEQQFLAHAKLTLMPIVTNIEQEADEKLFTERNKASAYPYYTRFNLRDLLRGDMEAFGKWVQSMTTSGHINSDEVRAMIDMPSQKDENGNTGIGKKYYIQGAMVEKGKEMDSKNIENQRMKNALSEIMNGYKIGHAKELEQ